VEELEGGGNAPGERALQMHVVDVNRTVKVTKGGSLQRFSALVVVGNGDGVVGWAMGKAPEVASAIDKAYSRAARSLFFFERFEGHTIFHDASAKFGASRVHIAPLPSGSGLKANATIAAVCRLAGIRDLRAKVLGSHSPHTTLRAVFEALDAVRSPEEVARRRGRTVIRVAA
jgi:small subunit ribosomal protein S5